MSMWQSWLIIHMTDRKSFQNGFIQQEQILLNSWQFNVTHARIEHHEFTPPRTHPIGTQRAKALNLSLSYKLKWYTKNVCKHKDEDFTVKVVARKGCLTFTKFLYFSLSKYFRQLFFYPLPSPHHTLMRLQRNLFISYFDRFKNCGCQNTYIWQIWNCNR